MWKQFGSVIFVVLALGCSAGTAKNEDNKTEPQTPENPEKLAQEQQQQQFDEDKKIVEKRIALLDKLTQEMEKLQNVKDKDKISPPGKLRIQEFNLKLMENEKELNTLPSERKEAVLKSLGPQLQQADERMKKMKINLMKKPVKT